MLDRDFLLYLAKFLVIVAVSVLGAAEALLRRVPRVCTRCATTSQGRQWYRVMVLYAAVVSGACAFSDGANYLNMPILVGLGISWFAILFGVGQPVCPACGGRTLVPTSSPIGEELLRDYHHHRAAVPASEKK